MCGDSSCPGRGVHRLLQKHRAPRKNGRERALFEKSPRQDICPAHLSQMFSFGPHGRDRGVVGDWAREKRTFLSTKGPLPPPHTHHFTPTGSRCLDRWPSLPYFFFLYFFYVFCNTNAANTAQQRWYVQLPHARFSSLSLSLARALNPFRGRVLAFFDVIITQQEKIPNPFQLGAGKRAQATTCLDAKRPHCTRRTAVTKHRRSSGVCYFETSSAYVSIHICISITRSTPWRAFFYL